MKDIKNPRILEPLHHFIENGSLRMRVLGPHPGLTGNRDGVGGDCSHVYGNLDRVYGNIKPDLFGVISPHAHGDLTGLKGLITNRGGDCTGKFGDAREVLDLVEGEAHQNTTGDASRLWGKSVSFKGDISRFESDNRREEEEEHAEAPRQ